MHPWIPIVHFGQASSSSLSVRCCLALVDLEAIIAPLRMHLLLNPSLPSFSGDLSTTTFPMSRPLSIATREGTVLIQHLLKALLELVGQQPWMGLCGGLATGGSDVQVARLHTRPQWESCTCHIYQISQCPPRLSIHARASDELFIFV
uniref:Retinoblastoma-like protein 1 n=1 Tax=Anthurium amnicola TaxID=1678845 RepID=A0A1D1ZBQ1_9ARAE